MFISKSDLNCTNLRLPKKQKTKKLNTSSTTPSAIEERNLHIRKSNFKETTRQIKTANTSQAPCKDSCSKLKTKRKRGRKLALASKLKTPKRETISNKCISRLHFSTDFRI
jgi:hypothetical protein